ncbi:polyphosphate kinase 1 [Methanofollis tationis]|uniref:Polyphosphate kinase n=1 Tax=Methanofollis tationis TaxID=81417 RepID=A0A7K4HQ12_9EURY|nr:polyphosphate kinase 1 [Methanofollis tationis]NVO66948.1 polyphosphate kinase 1 [Methanofollis tationis]
MIGPEDAHAVHDGKEGCDLLDLDAPGLYINRELSWLSFNRRVLEEAQDPAHPLLERLKFLAICGSNLDEFFMARVSGLLRQVEEGALETPPDGMTPGEQLAAIRTAVRSLYPAYAHCWEDDLLPALGAAGIAIARVADLDPSLRAALRETFETSILPTLTPMAFDAARPFPFISSLALSLAVVVRDGDGSSRFARVKVPVGLFGRFSPVDARSFVLLEDLVAANLDLLFPGMAIAGAWAFRVTRDAEIEVQIEEGSDLLTAVEEGVAHRRTADAVRLEVAADMPSDLVSFLAGHIGLLPEQVYGSPAPLALSDLWSLHALDRPDLRDAPFLPAVPPLLDPPEAAAERLRREDLLLYHPYDSFAAFVRFLSHAADDPAVLAIKITLYRIGADSPVLDALLAARKNGKQVTVLVELKAKFDETENISWARTLERAGVHVVLGHPRLKVHAKVCLIVMRHDSGILRIVHLGSGNYNPVTTRIYGDLSYMTADPAIAEDVGHLFNALTGYARPPGYKRLLVAPDHLRNGIVARINREIERHQTHGDGSIAWKMNGLLDGDVIRALYRASRAGVQVDLQVRGLCALRPGVPGVSENIRVLSIVGRFLEHARIYYFHNGGEPEVLLGSADMMPRNLNRRVEVLFPVPDPAIALEVKRIFDIHFADTVKGRWLCPDGTYLRARPEGETEPLSSQDWLITNRGVWHGRT